MSTQPKELAALEPMLASYLPARRWFRGKARPIERVTLAETIALTAPLTPPVTARDSAQAWLVIVAVHYADGGSEDYALPVTQVDAQRAQVLRQQSAHLVIGGLENGAALVDALGDDDVLRVLLERIGANATVQSGASILRFRSLDEGGVRSTSAPRAVAAEQSNTSIVFGEDLILKVVRKLEPGVSPDLEMGEFLTRAGYPYAPHVAGAIDLARGGGAPGTLAILHRFVPNRGDAWAFFEERLASTLATTRGDGLKGDVLGDDRARIERLATRIGAMHLALASRPDLPEFAPVPITVDERSALAGAVRGSLDAAFAGLSARAREMPSDVAARIAGLSGHREKLAALVDRFTKRDLAAVKMRVHGDLHLGQILVTNDDDFVLIDFEGEPARPLAERKGKRSPLVDVAGMLRSLHYATIAAARAPAQDGPGHDVSRRETLAQAWHSQASAEFLHAYFATVRGAPFLPTTEDDVRALLDFYVLEKCVYEVHYEMNNRPAWLAIPLAGLSQLIEDRNAL